LSMTGARVRGLLQRQRADIESLEGIYGQSGAGTSTSFPCFFCNKRGGVTQFSENSETSKTSRSFCGPRQYAKPQEMHQSQYLGLQASAGLGRASARLLGGVSSGPQNNVPSFWAEIDYRLILYELELNAQYCHNSCTGRNLQRVRTLFFLSEAEPRAGHPWTGVNFGRAGSLNFLCTAQQVFFQFSARLLREAEKSE